MKRCVQCWQMRDPKSFITPRGVVKRCASCRDFYSRRAKLPPEQRVLLARSSSRTGLRPAVTRVRCTDVSKNSKLGEIPSTMTTGDTCPPACGFYGAGCFAEFGLLRAHWKRTAAAGLAWGSFLRWVRALPAGQLWRHNVAGDLPGRGNRTAAAMLRALVAANRGRRGFTFTHKPLAGPALAAVRAANRAGFVVNLSADTPADADRLAALDAGPVVVVLPRPAGGPAGGPALTRWLDGAEGRAAALAAVRGARTPGGHAIVLCPAEGPARLTCADCGLCAVATRRAVIGFVAHGQWAARVEQTITLRRSATDYGPNATNALNSSPGQSGRVR